MEQRTAPRGQNCVVRILPQNAFGRLQPIRPGEAIAPHGQGSVHTRLCSSDIAEGSWHKTVGSGVRAPQESSQVRKLILMHRPNILLWQVKNCIPERPDPVPLTQLPYATVPEYASSVREQCRRSS